MRDKYKKLKFNTIKYFTRLSIGRQLLLGYLPLVILIIFVSLYVLYNIGGVNNISKSVIENDSVIISSADKLVSNLLGQEAYGQRYIILESNDMLAIFWQRSDEFNLVIDALRKLPEESASSCEEISTLHKKYNKAYKQFFIEENRSAELFKEKYEKEVKSYFEKMIALAGEMVESTKKERDQKMQEIGTVGVKTFWVTAVLTFLGILFGVCAAVLITRNISGSVNKLKIATNQISEGNFTDVICLNRNDELGDLADAFSAMARRLLRWEEMYLDASPLTRLPGGIAIDNILKKRLKAGRELAFCLIDLDNFKSFNDKYGYAMGNVIIKTTAKIIEASAEENGNGDDFVGHIGGDDFAVITSPDKVVAICGSIVDEFDIAIPEFYDETDRQCGYIEGHTRQGDKVDFPIMTVSIAIVSNDVQKHMNYIEVGEIAAELKEHAKLVPGSVYVTDRRIDEMQNKVIN